MENDFLPISLAALHDALIRVDEAPVECDGHTLMVSSALSAAKIPHVRLKGIVTRDQGNFLLTPHFWIRLGEYILDYRLRIWVRAMLGTEEAYMAPHGIFPLNSDKNGFIYSEQSVCPVMKINDGIIDLMTDGYASNLIIPEATINQYYKLPNSHGQS